MSAEKRLRNNVDVLEELLQDVPPFEMRVINPRGKPKVRVSIGRTGEHWARGEAVSFPVALDRALREFRDLYYEEFEVDDPEESLDPIVAMLESL